MSFYSEIIVKDPRFVSSARIADPALLEPATRAAVEAIIAASPVPLMLYETFRSSLRQQLLFSQGATKLRNVGVHHYGLAADLVKKTPGGEPSWLGDFSFLAPLARAHGLVWGGDWGAPSVHHSFVDSDHVQRVSLLDQARLLDGTWYPPDGYSPYGLPLAA